MAGARFTPIFFALVVTVISFVMPSGASDDRVPTTRSDDSLTVLVFSRTAGFQHDSIPDGVEAIRSLAERDQIMEVRATEDPKMFHDDALNGIDVVVFLNTTGDVLNEAQQSAFEKFIRSGGGYVGVHAAADTEYDWPWYGELVGAYFRSHPRIQEATIIVEDRTHPSTKHLEEEWTRTDEWYDYRASPRDDVTVLMSLNERTYEGGGMGDDHPIAWCHEYDGGRAWYTGLGHTKASYAEDAFIRHLLGGIRWAAGDDGESDDAVAVPSSISPSRDE